jgi:hypothetical protein
MDSGDLNRYFIEVPDRRFKMKLLSALDGFIEMPSSLHEIAIESVSFSRPLMKMLRRLKISELGDLVSVSYANLKKTRGCGTNTILELWSFSMRMLQLCSDGMNMLDQPDFKSSRIIVSSESTVNQFLHHINVFVSDLNERDRQVMLERFGAIDNRASTLQEIGARLSVTRERIRQISEGTLKDLRKFLSKSTDDVVNQLVKRCERAISPLTPAFLVDLADNDSASFCYPPSFYLRLLSEISDDLIIYIEDEESARDLEPGDPDVANELRKQLKQSGFLPLREVFGDLSRRITTYLEIDVNQFFRVILSSRFVLRQGAEPDVLLIANSGGRSRKNRIFKGSEANHLGDDAAHNSVPSSGLFPTDESNEVGDFDWQAYESLD